METQEIIKLVTEATTDVDGKKHLSCAKAHHLAQNHPVTLKEIGDCCNENSIRITHCQLGCFQ